MKGTSPLNNDEIRRVSAAFTAAGLNGKLATHSLRTSSKSHNSLQNGNDCR